MPPSEPAHSLASSFASLALSPSSSFDILSSPVSATGAGNDGTVVEDDDDDDDSEEDEFIVLHRSDSSTGLGEPLKAGLAATPVAGSRAEGAEGAGTHGPDHSTPTPEVHAAGQGELGDDEDRDSRPRRWADEGEDEGFLATTSSPKSLAADLAVPSRTSSRDSVPLHSPSHSSLCLSGPSSSLAPPDRKGSQASLLSNAASHFSVSNSETSSMPSERILYGGQRSRPPKGSKWSETESETDWCTEESASVVLDQFFNAADPFGSSGAAGGGQLGKLRFWQSLIVELGILPSPDVPWSALSSRASSTSSSTSDSGDSAGTVTQEDFPTTLTAAHRLLRAEAHVNLVDYLALRTKLADVQDEGEREKVRAELKGLRKSSRAALKWYMIRSRKYAKKRLVKSQWLTPLMTDLMR